MEKSIIKTLVFYEAFSLCLNANEIFKNLPDRESKNYFKLLKTLKKLVRKNILDEFNGYYFLKGKKKLYDLTIQKEKISQQKFEILNKYRKFFKVVPFIKGVFISGSLVLRGAGEGSDIDLLIITKKGAIWRTRIFMNLFLDFFGIRRKGKRVKDKLCLNHFVSQDNLEIKTKSLYDALNYKNIIPFYLRDKNLYKKFIRANSWIKNYATYKEEIFSQRLSHYDESLFTKMMEIFFHIFFPKPFETIFKYFELFFIKKNPLTYKKGARIVYNDQELIFHPEPMEEKILKYYNKRLKILKIS